jgi:hypothetical protein
LWFGDVQAADQYRWYETAFMFNPLIPGRSIQAPFSLDAGPEAASAVGAAIDKYAVAWPFTPLVVGDLDDFIDRWAGWFADAAQGRLGYPSHVPELPPDGSRRR